MCAVSGIRLSFAYVGHDAYIVTCVGDMVVALSLVDTFVYASVGAMLLVGGVLFTVLSLTDGPTFKTDEDVVDTDDEED